MGVSVFPAASAGGGAALPQGAVANVASGYAATGGWKYTTSTAAGTYQVSIQAPSTNLYGIETANGITRTDIPGGSVVPLKTTATEASITVGSYYPYQMVTMTSINGTIRNINGGNNLHIMTSSTGYLYTSTDSLTWTNRTSGGEGTGQSNYSATYVNDRWVIPGWASAAVNGRGLLYSTNGTTWTTLDLSASGIASRMIGIVYAAGLYVALGANTPTAGGTGAVSTSPDFSTWTARATPSAHQAQSIGYVNYEGTNYFLIGCNQGNLWYSTNGTSWTDGGNIFNSNTITGILSDGRRTIIFGGNNASTTEVAKISYLTPDGSSGPTNWNTISFVNAYAMSTSFNMGGIFLGTFIIYMAALGNTAATNTHPDTGVNQIKCITSTDGFTWTMRSMPGATRSSGPNQAQANGVVAFGISSRLYATTAYNSAAIHINSTALTSV